MSRFQVALNVSNLQEAVDFYSKLLGTKPAKLRPAYANFAVGDPPLKVVLIEDRDAGGSLNHLGVEVETPGEVARSGARLADEGLATVPEEGVACCFALQDKVWARDPDGIAWETYVVLDDVDAPVECACDSP